MCPVQRVPYIVRYAAIPTPKSITYAEQIATSPPYSQIAGMRSVIDVIVCASGAIQSVASLINDATDLKPPPTHTPKRIANLTNPTDSKAKPTRAATGQRTN